MNKPTDWNVMSKDVEPSLQGSLLLLAFPSELELDGGGYEYSVAWWEEDHWQDEDLMHQVNIFAAAYYCIITPPEKRN